MNIYKQIVEETAFCATHPTAKVGRNKQTMRWPAQCYRGWQNIANKKPSGCSIVIENGDYIIH